MTFRTDSTEVPESGIGAPVNRVEARDKVTGSARYTADVRLRGMVHATVVTSTISAGRVRRIDTTRAAAPGVITVITHRDRMPWRGTPADTGYLENRFPLADDKVTYYGFLQRQRVASHGVGDGAPGRTRSPPAVLVEEGGRGVLGEPAEREPRQVPSGLSGFADGGEEGDGAAFEPAGGVEQHTGGWPGRASADRPRRAAGGRGPRPGPTGTARPYGPSDPWRARWTGPTRCASR
jgi:hypothetical protein